MNGQAWENLVEFMREYGDDRELIKDALDIVSLIPPTRDEQVAQLWRADVDLAEPALAALIAATGLDIVCLRFLSVQERVSLFKKRTRPGGERLSKALDSLDDEVDMSTLSLSIGLHLDTEPDIVQRLGQPAIDYFINDIHEAFGDSHHSVDSLIYFYLGFAVTGQREKAHQLKNLVALVTKLIPLGEVRDEPGTWIILVA
jgi:hypothetical protein